jgi:hypothetical protein
MITFILLATVTIGVLAVVLGLLSIGGTIFTVLASDIIVAILIFWLLWRFLFKKK